MGASVTLIEAITLAIAILGAVLGVINTWHALDRSRVKLKVVPAHAIPSGGADPKIKFCIGVTNLSAFPVTISEVGVLYEGTNTRGAIVQPILADGGRWPRRLEPRSSVTVYGQAPDPDSPLRIHCAYATTECGHTKKGNSPALRQIAAKSARS